MGYFLTALRTNPELAIFLTLAGGFVLGRLKIGSFRVGNVVGTLLAGVVIGQLGIDVPAVVKVVFFDLFLFATGYKVGPQFIRGLGKSALPQVAVTLVLCVTSLVAAVIASKILGYDRGTAAGLLAGAFTESTVIGTAGDAITRLGLPEAETSRLLNNIAVAYAVTYLVGTTAAVWFLSSLAPRLLNVDLKAESAKLGALAPGGTSHIDMLSGYREWDMRAYRLADEWDGRKVLALEQSFAPDRVFVQQVHRRGQMFEAEPEFVLSAGDTIAVAARRWVVAGNDSLGQEVDDRAVLEFPLAVLDVVLTNKAVADRTLEDVAQEHGRGVALVTLIRGGEQIPFTATTTLNRGDLLRLAGASRDVERAGRALGYVERSSGGATDMVFVGLGIVLGGLVGLLSVTAAGMSFSLTASGGALVMGLVFGWLRSVHPTFGRIPEAALWVFDSVGLAVFIGVVGIDAGPGFVEGLRTSGVSLALVGLLVAVTPHLTAVLFGRYVLKMNPVILLGACAGAGTSTAALRSIQDEAQSKLPVLGYTVPYALGNILLTAWGPVIVLLTR